MVSELDLRIVDYRLENLAIPFRKYGPEWFCLTDHMAHGPLQQVMVDDAFDAAEHAQLPFDTSVTSFLGKPNVQLPPRKRERPMITFHWSPPTA
ncbi:hypothetical protein AOT86_07625 [Mycobacteroides sp. H072]|nr:hypothetical protein AOT86_07625 [Mycobacteroides sp. H072]